MVSTLSKQNLLSSRTQPRIGVKSITKKAVHGLQFCATLKIREKGKMRPFSRRSGAGNLKFYFNNDLFFWPLFPRSFYTLA